MQADSILELINWKLRRPEFQLWADAQKKPEEELTRSAAQIIRTAVMDASNFTGKPLPVVVSEVINGDEDILYGICDRFHIAQEICLKWIATYIDPSLLPAKDGKKFGNVLDYYGKTGEFSFRVARRSKCRVTYVDQQPWFQYAKFRFKAHSVHYVVKPFEATPQDSRPELGEKFGFISSLELPQVVTPDWVEWCERHLHYYGFLATYAEMPWKKVCRLGEQGFIYQFEPPTA